MGGKVIRWTARQDAHIRSWYDGKVPGRIRTLADHFGVNPWNVTARAKVLGLICPKPADWSAADDRILAAGLVLGLPDDVIAARLGRVRGSIANRRKRKGYQSRRKLTFSITRIGKIMGVEGKTVKWWVEQGWLAVHWGQRAGSSQERFAYARDLEAFMRDSRHWHRWTPERFTDAGLRGQAEDMRRGVRYLTVGECAERLGITSREVFRLFVRQKRVPTRRLGAARGNHVVLESDLEAFEMPVIYRRWTEEEEDLMFELLNDQRRTWKSIAKVLGRTETAVRGRWWQLTREERAA